MIEGRTLSWIGRLLMNLGIHWYISFRNAVDPLVRDQGKRGSKGQEPKGKVMMIAYQEETGNYSY